MQIDTKFALNLSRLGSRGVLGLALEDLIGNYDNARVIVADTMLSSKLEGVADKFPKRIINTGISEQNMASVAAGMASEGFNVFISSFAPFSTMRCFEMLRTQIGYMNLNVKIVGLLSGFAQGPGGNTHYALEDVALLRTVPNMTVESPSDGVATYKAVETALEYNGPMYLRLTGVNGFPSVYKEDFDYVLGRGIVLREGSDIAFIASGSMVNEVLRAAKLLSKQNLSSSVIDMHTIKPLDKDLMHRVFSAHKLVVTVEEHFVAGGLGSAVAEFATTLNRTCPQLMIGVGDEFLRAGSYAFMLKSAGLTAQDITAKALERYSSL